MCLQMANRALLFEKLPWEMVKLLFPQAIVLIQASIPPFMETFFLHVETIL